MSPKSAGLNTMGITATGLTVMTKTLRYPTCNLAGYATAQKLASTTGWLIIGPKLSAIIATIGGPKVAALLLAATFGLIAAGVVALFNWIFR